MSAPASQNQWYLARDGQQFGPLSELELAKFIELGHLQPTDLLWREGFPDWRPALVVFPPRRPAPARPAQPMRAAQAPTPQTPSPRIAAERAPAFQAQKPRAATSGVQNTHRERFREDEEPEGRGGGLRRALLSIVFLAALGATGWYAYPHRVVLLKIAKTLPSRVVALVPAMDGKGKDAVVALKGVGGTPDAIDGRLQANRMWRIIKQEFPDWYADRLKEAAALAAQDKGEEAIGQQLARAVVALRRQQVNHALAAGFPQLKAIASTFYENLVQLRKHSVEACFAFISQGEASPTIVALMQDSAHASASAGAIDGGVRSHRRWAQDARASIPSPARQTTTRSPAILPSGAGARPTCSCFPTSRLCRTRRPKRCASSCTIGSPRSLEVKDPDMQLRLLVDSLKPVVAG